MKKTILILSLVLSLISNAVLLTIHIKDNERYPDYSPEQIQDWNTFITALAWVESRWNDNAESPKQAVGYLQLTPIIVKDANRIVGHEEFSLDSRNDREQSIEIFNIIMDNYNPQHDMQYALKIWNPYAKVSYHRAVMRKYNELKKEI